MRTLVTGGLGFVGAKLVEALVGSGELVNILNLPVPGVSPGRHGRKNIFLGDIRSETAVAEAMKNCDRVFHLAAYARNWAKDPNTFFDVNVRGTHTVLSMARALGVSRVVYTSSNLTLGPSNGDAITESIPRTTDFFTEYERSKFLAENLVRNYVRQGLDVVIVNPTRIYGPGPLDESNSVTKMILWYLQGKWRLILGNGNAVGNYVYVEDVVRGHMLAMARGKTNENYILGGENVSFNNFFAQLAQVGGRTFRLMHLPASIALSFSRFERLRAHLFGHYPLITPGWARTFLTDWQNSCAKAQTDLRYVPLGLNDGMVRTVRWLESSGLC